MSKQFYVYRLASKPNGTLYVGVTSDLVKRTWEHKQDLAEGFTKKYGVKTWSTTRFTTAPMRPSPEKSR